MVKAYGWVCKDPSSNPWMVFQKQNEKATSFILVQRFNNKQVVLAIHESLTLFLFCCSYMSAQFNSPYVAIWKAFSFSLALSWSLSYTPTHAWC